ncbi:MAG: DUF362 domain-containing protein [Candidatus Omnitrophota bacterium]|nr:DUF362 domain-containing protein [Candidatus Omnitrophota bacterium]
MSAKVSIVKCNSYEPKAVQQAIRDILSFLGGITAFIKPGSSVLVKPNLLMAKEPQSGITTHPEVVRAVIQILKEINCRVVVGDGPSVWGRYVENVEGVYDITGIKKVCQDEEVKLVIFDKRRMRDKFPLTTWLDDCEYLINLPKFKTHEFTLLTGSIKNLFGLVSGTYKTELHKNYFEPAEFSKILVDIYEQAKPALTIIDGVLAMEGDGPATGGKTRQLGLLLGGSDCVALDTIMAKIMGITNQEILSTKEAALRGLGENQISRISIEGENIDKLNIRPFIMPTNSIMISKLPAPIKKILKPLIRYYPYCLNTKCIRCGHCVEVCPRRCIKLKNKGVRFDYKNCIACFCCQETCPQAAIKVKKSILAKLIGL